jgi:hypothetical protein
MLSSFACVSDLPRSGYRTQPRVCVGLTAKQLQSSAQGVCRIDREAVTELSPGRVSD